MITRLLAIMPIVLLLSSSIFSSPNQSCLPDVTAPPRAVRLEIQEVANRLAPCNVPKEELRSVVEAALHTKGIHIVQDYLAPSLILRVTGYLNEGYGEFGVELRLEEQVEVARPAGRCTAIATTWSQRSSPHPIDAKTCGRVTDRVSMMAADFGLLGRLAVPGVVE